MIDDYTLTDFLVHISAKQLVRAVRTPLNVALVQCVTAICSVSANQASSHLVGVQLIAGVLAVSVLRSLQVGLVSVAEAHKKKLS